MNNQTINYHTANKWNTQNYNKIRLISLFNIIGPIMIGPSSSHTAGAVRLGNECYKKLKNFPEKVEITLYNSFADTGIGHGTNEAILAGCMGISCDDARLKDAFNIAKKKKLKYVIKTAHNPKYHPNTAAIKLSYKDNQARLIGVSLGGGRITVYDYSESRKFNYDAKKNSVKNINKNDLFYTISSYIKKCNNKPDKLIDMVIAREIKLSNKSSEEIMKYMYDVWQVMKNGIEENIEKKNKMFKGLCGGDAYKMKNNNNSELLSTLSADAIAYALAIGERNVAMNKIVAAPTAGSAGILPGCLYSLYKNKKISEESAVKSLFIASVIGLVIANRATLAGSEGGCQAECGSAGAMAAGAVTYLMCGSLDQIDNAAAVALSNSLGLVCDPISGLAAVPCIQRNGIFANLALSAAAMALAGIDFVVPCDEVIDTMFKIGQAMPCQLRETSKGGLAVTKTGIKYNKILFSHKHIYTRLSL